MEIYVETERFARNDYAISFCLYHFRIFSENFNCILYQIGLWNIHLYEWNHFIGMTA